MNPIEELVAVVIARGFEGDAPQGPFSVQCEGDDCDILGDSGASVLNRLRGYGGLAAPKMVADALAQALNQ